MHEGITEELRTIDLGDERLNRRSRQILPRLFSQPTSSVNGAISGWSETFAAYRFLENERVDPKQILAAHRRESLRRMDAEPVVLIVQDTTELDYTSHPPRDAEYLNRESRRGLYDHTHLAFTPAGLCLGVLDVHFFARSFESLGKTAERKSAPIQTKESRRWLDGYSLANEVKRAHPEKRVVSVADREGDFFDIYLAASEEENLADYVIRLKLPRSTFERDPDAGKCAYVKARQSVESSEVLAVRQVDLTRTPKRVARTATLEIRAQTLTIKPPHARSQLGAVTMNFVSVIEINRPSDDSTAVNWFLGTSLPVDSLDNVLTVIDYYRGRWPIEIFFRIFKTGCQIEQLQLETTQRLKRCLMFYKIIAWRILYLTYLGRECPDIPCDLAFDSHEWIPVWRIVTKKPVPKTPPTLNQFLNILATLGGYNNRKEDPPPGPKAIWMGITRMLDFAIAWQTFGPG